MDDAARLSSSALSSTPPRPLCAASAAATARGPVDSFDFAPGPSVSDPRPDSASRHAPRRAAAQCAPSAWPVGCRPRKARQEGHQAQVCPSRRQDESTRGRQTQHKALSATRLPVYRALLFLLPPKLPKLTCRRPAAPARNDPRQERLAPSRESGGVPEPTPLYLARSFAPPAALPQPRRILVILDLNGTVLYRPTRYQPTTFVERPHARRFLDYCLEAFHLAIWSSARPENVQNMLSQLLTRKQRKQCVVTWARDRLGLSQNDYNLRVQCYKRLDAVWNNDEVQASHPTADRGGRWDQSNTVLVDDSREKGRSEPYNILAVPEFSGPENEMADVLPQVHDYLNVLCYQQDISRYMRLNPFELDPSYRLSASPPPRA